MHRFSCRVGLAARRRLRFAGGERVSEEAKWNTCWRGLATVAWKRRAFPLDRLFWDGQNGVRVLPLGGDRAGEVRRFLHNPRVTPSEMVATAHARTTAGLVKGRQLLAIQDTCAMSAISAAGTYPAIAVDAKDGALLGLVHAVFLHRTGGKSGQPNNQPRPPGLPG
jgi:hypothetical protein